MSRVCAILTHHQQELTALFYLQAQFLREYKLVVVGGGGEFQAAEIRWTMSDNTCSNQVSVNLPSPSNSFKVTSSTNTTQQSRV